MNFAENLRNVDIKDLSNTPRAMSWEGKTVAIFCTNIINLSIGFYEKFDHEKLKKFHSILEMQAILYGGTSTGQLKNLRNVDIRHLSNTFRHRYLEKGNTITFLSVRVFNTIPSYFSNSHPIPFRIVLML